MILTTTETISGRELETLGLVRGSTIQSKNIGKDITQGFKTLVGGELKAYTEMMNEARALATKRMVEDAEQLGADAVVCMRYASAAVMQGAAEVIAYGTAVKLIGNRKRAGGRPAGRPPALRFRETSPQDPQIRKRKGWLSHCVTG